MLALTLLLAVPFTAADMLEIQSFARGQPITLSSDGAYVAYVLTDIDDEANILERRPTGHIHVMQIGESAAALTSGATSSAYPVWSPDGMRLAFFHVDGDGGVLALWDRKTGETRVLGERFTGKAYLAPQWDREGRRIVFRRSRARAADGPAAPGPSHALRGRPHPGGHVLSRSPTCSARVIKYWQYRKSRQYRARRAKRTFDPRAATCLYRNPGGRPRLVLRRHRGELRPHRPTAARGLHCASRRKCCAAADAAR